MVTALPFSIDHVDVIDNVPARLKTRKLARRKWLVPGTSTTLVTYAEKLRYTLTNDRGVLRFQSGAPTGGKAPRTMANGDTALFQIPSWSIPAMTTCPGKVATALDDICSGCLAFGESTKVSATGKVAKRGGRYAIEDVKAAQMARFVWTAQSMKTQAGRDAWVDLMTRTIRAMTATVKLYRIHDSGDFFSPVYVGMWRKVVRALPDVQFWASTRSYHGRAAGDGTLLGMAVRGLRSEPNVAVRFSGLKVNGPVPTDDPVYGTTVVTHDRHGWLDANGGDVHLCPARTQGNVCGGCVGPSGTVPACFDAVPVAFRYH